MKKVFKLASETRLFDAWPLMRLYTRLCPDWMIPGQTGARRLFNAESGLFMTLWEKANHEYARGELVACILEICHTCWHLSNDGI